MFGGMWCCNDESKDKDIVMPVVQSQGVLPVGEEDRARAGGKMKKNKKKPAAPFEEPKMVELKIPTEQLVREDSTTATTASCGRSEGQDLATEEKFGSEPISSPCLFGSTVSKAKGKARKAEQRAEEAEERARPFLFDVQIERLTGQWGMVVEKLSRGFVVAHIFGVGSISWHNDSVEPAKQLRAFDWILAVNDKTTVSEVRDELIHAEAASFKVCRPALHTARVKMAGRKAGITFRGAEVGGAALEVAEVMDDGAIQAYNSTSPLERHIAAGDCLVSVNRSRVPEKMLELLGTSEEVEMTWVKPPQT